MRFQSAWATRRRHLGRVMLACGLVICGLALASLAAATAIGSAKYAGTASDLAGIQFTVSSDGTLLTGYRFTDVRAGTCSFTSEADPGTWPGVPITGNSFSYNPNPWFSFHGRFGTGQRAQGTLRLQQGATGSTPACDTGVLTWTATTSSKPPAGRPPIVTMVSLRRLTARLSGELRSSSSVCRRRRVVTLWKGGQRMASTRARRDGRFHFVLSGDLVGKQVRASVRSTRSAGKRCAASSSLFVTA